MTARQQRRGIMAASRRRTSFVTITDSFNRADSATTLGNTDTGQPWSILTPATTFGISSNKAYIITGNAQRHAVVDAAVSDCTVTVTVSGDTDTGMCFRATDTDNLWITNGANLFKRVATNFTSMGTFAYTTGDTISAVLSGTSIILKKNGSTLLSLTDSFNQTATKHGLRNFNSLASRWDDFSITVP